MDEDLEARLDQIVFHHNGWWPETRDEIAALIRRQHAVPSGMTREALTEVLARWYAGDVAAQWVREMCEPAADAVLAAFPAFGQEPAAVRHAVAHQAETDYEYGSALREANGEMWDYELHGEWTDADLARHNAEHRAGIGDDDGSRIVRVRRVKQGEWEVIPADRLDAG